MDYTQQLPSLYLRNASFQRRRIRIKWKWPKTQVMMHTVVHYVRTHTQATKFYKILLILCKEDRNEASVYYVQLCCVAIVKSIVNTLCLPVPMYIYHPLKWGHLSNRDTSSGPNSIEACTYHPLKWGHLSNRDTFQVPTPLKPLWNKDTSPIGTHLQ